MNSNPDKKTKGLANYHKVLNEVNEELSKSNKRISFYQGYPIVVGRYSELIKLVIFVPAVLALSSFLFFPSSTTTLFGLVIMFICLASYTWYCLKEEEKEDNKTKEEIDREMELTNKVHEANNNIL